MVGLAGLVAVCVSLLPASRVWSAKLTLMRGTRGLPGRSVTRWGRRLAAAQVALSVPLLVTAWIVAANLHRLEGVNTGFRPDGVIVASTDQSRRRSTQPRTPSRISPSSPQHSARVLASRRRRCPGTNRCPSVLIGVDAPSPGATAFTASGRLSCRCRQATLRRWACRSWPAAISRGPTTAGQRDVAIISAGLATALFPGADPVGRRVRLGGQPDRLLEVIGVVADAKLAEPHATNQLFLFTALLQEPRTVPCNSVAPGVAEVSASAKRPLRRWRGARLSPLDETMSSRSIPCSTRWMPRCFANA